MPVADFQSLMLPVLRGVADGDISAADLRNRIGVELRLTEADLAEMLPSGRQTTFANRTAWANVFFAAGRSVGEGEPKRLSDQLRRPPCAGRAS